VTSCRIVTAASEKGGAGKSTAIVSIAGAAAELGERVLVIDVDPQAAATAALGATATKPTLYEVLLGGAGPHEAISHTAGGIDVIPADDDLAAAALQLPSQDGWQRALRRAVDVVASDYTLVLIDTPPGLGVLPFIGLAAADSVITTCPPHYAALRLVDRLLDTIRRAEPYAPGLELAAVIPWQVTRRTLHQDEALEEIIRRWGTLELAPVPDRVAVRDAAVSGVPITGFAPTSDIADVIRTITKEILTRVPLTERARR
jgi:chromosome partitioning protein